MPKFVWKLETEISKKKISCVLDARGRVIAFGGRVLPGADKEAPKYINSPESPLYKKSQVLYGHAQGREAIRRSGRVIIVEGYTDVCMAHQHGVGEVVACCGTSLTEEHEAYRDMELSRVGS